MGGGLAPFGVGVVDMVVEGDLVPLLRHLQEVIAPQFLADGARLSRYGHPEVVRQLQLPGMIPLHPDQLLHDLQEDPCGIVAERAVGDIHHLVVKGAQGAQAVIGLPDLQGAEQVDHRISDAEPLGGGHLLDAVRVQIGVEQILEFFPGGLPVEDILDQSEEFMVLPVEEEF